MTDVSVIGNPFVLMSRSDETDLTTGKIQLIDLITSCCPSIGHIKPIKKNQRSGVEKCFEVTFLEKEK